MHSSTRTTLISNEKEGTQYHPLQSTELLTVKDVAEILRVPVSWVYDRTRKRSFDRLPGIRLGKYWRLRQDEIVEWLSRQQS
jgi:excisionase family DNA binding protein